MTDTTHKPFKYLGYDIVPVFVRWRWQVRGRFPVLPITEKARVVSVGSELLPSPKAARKKAREYAKMYGRASSH